MINLSNILTRCYIRSLEKPNCRYIENIVEQTIKWPTFDNIMILLINIYVMFIIFFLYLDLDIFSAHNNNRVINFDQISIQRYHNDRKIIVTKLTLFCTISKIWHLLNWIWNTKCFTNNPIKDVFITNPEQNTINILKSICLNLTFV